MGREANETGIEGYLLKRGILELFEAFSCLYVKERGNVLDDDGFEDKMMMMVTMAMVTMIDRPGDCETDDIGCQTDLPRPNVHRDPLLGFQLCRKCESKYR